MKVCEKQQVTAIMGFNDDFLPKNGNFNWCREIFRSKILEIGKRGSGIDSDQFTCKPTMGNKSEMKSQMWEYESIFENWVVIYKMWVTALIKFSLKGRLDGLMRVPRAKSTFNFRFPMNGNVSCCTIKAASETDNSSQFRLEPFRQQHEGKSSSFLQLTDSSLNGILF